MLARNAAISGAKPRRRRANGLIGASPQFCPFRANTSGGAPIVMPGTTSSRSAQASAPFGPGCTRVKTDRTRTYLDGRTDVDSFFALYQPAEGVKCR